MEGRPGAWEKLGRILRADGSVPWMHDFTGSAVADPRPGSAEVDVYVTGRGADNRSMIGRIRIDLERQGRVVGVEGEPVLVPGELGAFDENGVSYPALIRRDGSLFMFYTGWMPTVLTPFQNHLGMAVQGADGTFERVSRAPILPRSDGDPFSIGSSFALVEDGVWHLWYTSWLEWFTGPDTAKPGHRYVIKYATSADGRQWERENRICVGGEREGDHSICRPAVLAHGGLYHMWFCYRGDHYRIGYACSPDGVDWTRRDELAGIDLSAEGWDSRDMCYPHVFRYQDALYMLYCGNEFGREGLGLARLRL